MSLELYFRRISPWKYESSVCQSRRGYCSGSKHRFFTRIQYAYMTVAVVLHSFMIQQKHTLCLLKRVSSSFAEHHDISSYQSQKEYALTLRSSHEFVVQDALCSYPKLCCISIHMYLLHRIEQCQISEPYFLRHGAWITVTLHRSSIPSEKSIQRYSKSLICSHGLGFPWIWLDMTGYDWFSLVLYDVIRLSNSLVRYFWKMLENAGQNETSWISLYIIRSIFHWAPSPASKVATATKEMTVTQLSGNIVIARKTHGQQWFKRAVLFSRRINAFSNWYVRRH